MNEREFAQELQLILEAGGAEQGPLDPEQVVRVEDFESVGMLTHDVGLVVMMKDGSEFQLTVVQSRHVRD